jgi:thymidine phosphorylase
MVAERSGLVVKVEARAVGRAAFALGAGRASADERIDPEVGLVLHVSPGDEVSVGDALATVNHRSGRGLEGALSALNEAILVGVEPTFTLPLVGRRW